MGQRYPDLSCAQPDFYLYFRLPARPTQYQYSIEFEAYQLGDPARPHRSISMQNLHADVESPQKLYEFNMMEALYCNSFMGKTTIPGDVIMIYLSGVNPSTKCRVFGTRCHQLTLLPAATCPF